MRLGEFVRRIGTALGQFRSPEQKTYVPSQLSLEAQEVLKESMIWSDRIFKVCNFSKFFGKSVSDKYVERLFRLGFCQAAFQSGYYPEGDKYGVGRVLSLGIFSEVEGWFANQKQAQTDSLIRFLDTQDPFINASWIQVQEKICHEAGEIFEQFYGFWQLGMYGPDAVKEQIARSLSIIHGKTEGYLFIPPRVEI